MNNPATPAVQAPTSVGALPAASPEPSDLAVAVRVAQKMLTAYGDSSREDFSYPAAYGALAESVRLLLRALDAEPVSEEEAARRFVDRHFPQVAAFLADERGETR